MYNVKLHRETSGTRFGLVKDDIRYDDPIATCDMCGRQGIQSDYLNLVVVTGSLGHHSLVHLKQQPAELWACSLDCWLQIFVLTGTDLAREIIEINAGEERSNHHDRAKVLIHQTGNSLIRASQEVYRLDSVSQADSREPRK